MEDFLKVPEKEFIVTPLYEKNSDIATGLLLISETQEIFLTGKQLGVNCTAIYSNPIYPEKYLNQLTKKPILGYSLIGYEFKSNYGEIRVGFLKGVIRNPNFHNEKFGEYWFGGKVNDE